MYWHCLEKYYGQIFKANGKLGDADHRMLVRGSGHTHRRPFPAATFIPSSSDV
jgi:hypothetical protein